MNAVIAVEDGLLTLASVSLAPGGIRFEVLMPDRSKFTVLIVDDEPQVRGFLRRVLDATQWCVVEAADGAAALDIVETIRSIDLLITDIEMPNMDGRELGAACRLLIPGIKVLYVTGFADMLFERRALLSAEEAFLEKPITSAGLREAVTLLAFGEINVPEVWGVGPGTVGAEGAITRLPARHQ